MLAAGESAYLFPEVEDAAASFGPLRPRLLRIAYRMLGSVSDAEDVVQEGFIRWMKADRAIVRGNGARLTSAPGSLSLWSRTRRKRART
jgi:RNA polymerase sigma-70 factor (ECF subfamily)